jgi:hypothetical protein
MPRPMMPKNVARFELLAYTAIALNVMSLPLNWRMIGTYFDKYPIGYPLLAVVLFALKLLWIWLIARKRQNWARLISPIYMIIGLLE